MYIHQEVKQMVRVEIQEKVGQEVNVRARVSVPWDGRRVAWCVEKIVIDDEVEVDHSWIQVRDNPEINDVIGRNPRGSWVEFKGVIGSYHKKGGVVDYNIQGGHQ
jgi:hypothetical protein